jgi:hypothetical protein
LAAGTNRCGRRARVCCLTLVRGKFQPDHGDARLE